MLSIFTWFIIIFILLLISACSIQKYPDCYKPVESEKSSDFNPCCTGNACTFKLDCQYYKNYINDN